MNFGTINHLILFGGEFMLASLAARVRETGWAVDIVTSQRDSEADLAPLPISLGAYLDERQLRWIVSPDVNNDPKVHGMITPQTLGISMGAAWIFEPGFIDRFAGRLVNMHGTRLPKDRGGGGFSWRILSRERLGYSLIHMIEPGVDTGDIVTYDEYFYPDTCRLPVDYREHAAAKDSGLVDRFLADIRSGQDFQTLSQPEYLSEYWPRLNTDAHAFIDWSWTLTDIEQFVCAFDDPYPGAQTFVKDQKVRLKKCFSITVDGPFHPFQTGIVYRMRSGALFIAAEQGILVVESITDDDGNDLLDKMRVGERFHTPADQLDAAKRFHAVYTPRGLKT